MLAEVCPRRRQGKECVTALREGQGEKSLAALRHDAQHVRRPSVRVNSYTPYIEMEL